jgi:hypothetical protein
MRHCVVAVKCPQCLHSVQRSVAACSSLLDQLHCNPNTVWSRKQLCPKDHSQARPIDHSQRALWDVRAD